MMLVVGIESVNDLISASVDFAPIIFFQFIEIRLVFRGKLVALDLCVEVVGDEGSLHT